MMMLMELMKLLVIQMGMNLFYTNNHKFEEGECLSTKIFDIQELSG
jgi:hypothetical protein